MLVKGGIYIPLIELEKGPITFTLKFLLTLWAASSLVLMLEVGGCIGSFEG